MFTILKYLFILLRSLSLRIALQTKGCEKNMSRFRLRGLIGTVLIAALTLSSGCASTAAGREEIQVGSQKITVLDAKPQSGAGYTAASDTLDYGKIDRYEGIKGEGWLSDDSILVTQENPEIAPIQVFDQMSRVRNLYAYDLKTGEEKGMAEKTAYIWAPIVSPDGKHIFYEKFEAGQYTGILATLEGAAVASVPVDAEHGLNLSFRQAEWVNNEEVLVPSSDNGVCLINVNSDVTKVSNIGLMQTGHASKVGNTIYYVSTDRSLVAYDIPSKRSSVVKSNVLEFELSPDKNLFAIQKRVSDSKTALVLTDLSGKETVTLTEGNQVFGISWSPDQSKLACLVTSSDESKNGLHIFDVMSHEDLYISRDFLNTDSGLFWSPSGNKLLASISTVKEMTLVDNTYIITLK